VESAFESKSQVKREKFSQKQHLMNAFNEMNYHQIKSRESFLFMFSALAAAAAVESFPEEN
jgi:hypothetical protein